MPGLRLVIDAIFVHGVLSSRTVNTGIVQTEALRHVFVSDTIPLSLLCTKLKRYTVSDILAEAVERIVNDEKVDDLLVDD